MNRFMPNYLEVGHNSCLITWAYIRICSFFGVCIRSEGGGYIPGVGGIIFEMKFDHKFHKLHVFGSKTSNLYELICKSEKSKRGFIYYVNHYIEQ